MRTLAFAALLFAVATTAALAADDNYWPKDVWTAIKAHQVKPGMSELETRLAIGQKVHVDGSQEGDRTVTYDVNGKKWDVTYVKNRATEIKSE